MTISKHSMHGLVFSDFLTEKKTALNMLLHVIIGVFDLDLIYNKP